MKLALRRSTSDDVGVIAQNVDAEERARARNLECVRRKTGDKDQPEKEQHDKTDQ